MSGVDLVVTVSTDQEQMLYVLLGQQIFQYVERRCVEPLQIIEKYCQRMLWPREHTDKTAEYELKTPLRVLGWKFGDRSRLSRDELQLRDQIDHELGVRSQRLTKGIAPGCQLGFALREKAPNKALEGLCKCGIRDVALVLIELPRRE